MMPKDLLRVFFIGFTLLSLSACTATRTSLIDVRAAIEPTNSEKAQKAIAMALVDKGFELKIHDKDLRMTTTEYKKFAMVSGWPPFDFYFQVKAVVRDTPDGRYAIALTPKIKEQNRINASAFTEHDLIMYSEQERKGDYVTQSGRGKAMLDGQLLFLSIVQSIADALGMPVEQFKHNVRQVEVLGM